MNPDQAEAQLFADALVCVDELPYRLSPRPSGIEFRSAAVAAAERLLHSLVALESSLPEEAEPGLTDSALQRLDAKLDLVLDLLSRLLASEQPTLLARPLRWSRLGARIEVSEAPQVGSPQLLILHLQTGLPVPLKLPVDVLAVAPGAGGLHIAWLAFPTDAAGLEAELQRLLFRQHRRQIAASRRG
ncbi:PilZ domain-containing protein [Aquimonas sp.]|jgi:hypothetical protein|uniref:PilZ domain-containing protein n=1 Tax=Aquimonas sp. TaxID=1872588 RepID=UPI0037BE3DD8